MLSISNRPSFRDTFLVRISACTYKNKRLTAVESKQRSWMWRIWNDLRVYLIKIIIIVYLLTNERKNRRCCVELNGQQSFRMMKFNVLNKCYSICSSKRKSISPDSNEPMRILDGRLCVIHKVKLMFKWLINRHDN